MQTAINAPSAEWPEITLDDLFSVPALAAKHPEILTEAALRWQLRHRDVNGLAPACVRVGKKLLISGRRYGVFLSRRAGSSAGFAVSSALPNGKGGAA